ncbi:hypothetical protein DOTSEDRAFT_71473 [Dothistroma septosporum NZE10]|uniref:Heterokaryon incompatibility domain-containing protein n=1 Tax=Dothistroma septosporum (strain NZE10 / CBS 128990) TaxID=675120 RepID=N1PTW0_DOTSN|nr:hypothetical protein DOTSEDRAFT_71473 [Dothistroma septosporum NZE10]
MPWFRSSKKSAQVADVTTSSVHSTTYSNGSIGLNPSQRNRHAVPSDAQAAPFRSTSSTPLPVYQPISSEKKVIRLLELTPGASHDPIRCYTHYISLSAADIMPYETVSYCWGESKRDFDIVLDRVPARIESSAGRLLQRLRESGKRRIVWIDAVCIDQDDDAEKSGQVAMMGDIYRCGWRNVVWLGDCPQPGLEDAVHVAIRNVLADMRNHVDGDDKLYEFTHKDPTTTRPRFYPKGNLLDQRIDLRSLVTFFSTKWFDRVWVVQEVVLPKTSLCHYGSITLQLADICKVAAWLLWNHRVLYPRELGTTSGLSHALSIWSLADKTAIPKHVHDRSDPSLLELCLKTEGYEATEPKDKVYALLGMSTVSRSPYMPLLQPRYGKEVSVTEVYRDATRAMIAESASLHILQFCSRQATMLLDRPAPSWVVNFEQMGLQQTMPVRLGLAFDTNLGQKANRCTRVAAKDPDVLTVAGFQVDQVAQYTDPFTADPNTELAVMKQALALTATLSKRFPKLDFTKQLSETLIGGIDWVGNAAGPKQSLNFDAFVKYLRLEEPRGSNPSSRKPTAEQNAYTARTYSKAMRRACMGRRFFVTARGLMGIGPAELSRNTTIVILYGGKVPFALEAAPGRKGKVTLLGECYLALCMYGEMMSMHKEKGGRDEKYEIV